MTTKIIARGLCLAALLISADAWAGTGQGTISAVTIEGANGKFLVSTGHGDAPACATSGRFAVDVTTAKGQAMWSTLLLAFSMSKSISVTGTGACDVWFDSETVSWLKIL